jgi:hypothetical protein
MHLPFQEKSMNPLHLLKLMVNNNMTSMEDILDSWISNSQLQYLVRWHGYDVSMHTWEPFKNLSNAMEKVHEFH